MEQRKLIQHGNSSLTIALPLKWLKQRNLKKGDSLNIEEEGNKLILGTEKGFESDKISIDVSKLDRTSLLLYIQSLYRFGYNEIEVKFDNPLTKHYRKNEVVSISSVIHSIVARCIGFEIIKQTKDEITIKYLTKESKEDFKIILRRIFLLVNDISENLIQGIKNQDLDLVAAVEQQHDNINNFTNYCLRLLNKYGHPDVKQTCFYYHIIASLDKIVDILKYNARDILNYKKKLNKDTIIILEQINKSIEGYYDLFYKFNLVTVDKLSENRDLVKNMFKDKLKTLPNEEIIYLTKMIQILEIILDLTDSRLGLEY